jgi:hypothetical protein
VSSRSRFSPSPPASPVGMELDLAVGLLYILLALVLLAVDVGLVFVVCAPVANGEMPSGFLLPVLPFGPRWSPCLRLLMDDSVSSENGRPNFYVIF